MNDVERVRGRRDVAKTLVAQQCGQAIRLLGDRCPEQKCRHVRAKILEPAAIGMRRHSPAAGRQYPDQAGSGGMVETTRRQGGNTGAGKNFVHAKVSWHVYLDAVDNASDSNGSTDWPNEQECPPATKHGEQRDEDVEMNLDAQ